MVGPFYLSSAYPSPATATRATAQTPLPAHTAAPTPPAFPTADAAVQNPLAPHCPAKLPPPHPQPERDPPPSLAEYETASMPSPPASPRSIQAAVRIPLAPAPRPTARANLSPGKKLHPQSIRSSAAPEAFHPPQDPPRAR